MNVVRTKSGQERQSTRTYVPLDRDLLSWTPPQSWHAFNKE